MSERPSDTEEYLNTLNYYLDQRKKLDRNVRSVQRDFSISTQYRGIKLELLGSQIQGLGDLETYIFSLAELISMHDQTSEILCILDFCLSCINSQTPKDKEGKLINKFNRFARNRVRSLRP